MTHLFFYDIFLFFNDQLVRAGKTTGIELLVYREVWRSTSFDGRLFLLSVNGSVSVCWPGGLQEAASCVPSDCRDIVMVHLSISRACFAALVVAHGGGNDSKTGVTEAQLSLPEVVNVNVTHAMVSAAKTKAMAISEVMKVQ